MASRDFRLWLDQNNVDYRTLDYDDPSESLAALSTWGFGDADETTEFTDTPVLIFDKVLWENDDGTDSYTKKLYARSSSDLPSDFLTLVETIS